MTVGTVLPTGSAGYIICMYIFFSPYVAGTGEYENEDLRLIFSQKKYLLKFHRGSYRDGLDGI